MEITNDDFNLLRKVSLEIDEYFKVTFDIKEARSTDIYEFLKNRKLLRGKFPTGAEFNRFLRKMHKENLIKQLIPNSAVDTFNPNFYQWRFYRKRNKNISKEINSESRISSSNFFKGNKVIPVNNGDFVRSAQEQYIYNRLLNESNLLIHYERELTGVDFKKFPDFTIAHKLSKIVFHWEHFGMADDTEYSSKIEEKINWYLKFGYTPIENGGRLIITYYKNEPDFHNDVERIVRLIKNSFS